MSIFSFCGSSVLLVTLLCSGQQLPFALSAVIDLCSSIQRLSSSSQLNHLVINRCTLRACCVIDLCWVFSDMVALEEGRQWTE